MVVNKTRLEQLIERFNTKAQARFYIEHSGGNFNDYEEEHDTFYRTLEFTTKTVSRLSKLNLVQRKYLPTYLFGEKEAVVALGQDGLVANVAKYVKGLPILGMNPDRKRFDGILLPFSTDNFESGLTGVLENKFTSRHVTMAQATTSDGQTLQAFNDLFIGPATHTSARYKIRFGTKTENQSSSGLIVSTGAGSTGWLSSVVNMTNGVQAAFHSAGNKLNIKMKWEDDRLAFVVREPFLSKYSQINLTAGMITQKDSLELESYMPFNGVIFSDGIESDFLHFNSGCRVTISLAAQKANIVQAL